MAGGCATAPNVRVWDAERMPANVTRVRLTYPDAQGQEVEAGVVRLADVELFRRTLQRIAAEASLQPVRGFVSDQEAPNASAGFSKTGEAQVAISIKMLELLREDRDAMAALVGHEVAHLAKGHGKARAEAKDNASGVGTAIGTVLQIAGVPLGRTLAGMGANAVAAAYSRDQEREADELGVRLAHRAGFDPQGAVRLLGALQRSGSGPRIPFFATHPYVDERLADIGALAARLKSGQGD
jgi:predicted Zn-dependent protease